MRFQQSQGCAKHGTACCMTCWALNRSRCSSGLPTNICDCPAASIPCSGSCPVCQQPCREPQSPRHSAVSASHQWALSVCTQASRKASLASVQHPLLEPHKGQSQVFRQPCTAVSMALCTTPCCSTPVSKCDEVSPPNSGHPHVWMCRWRCRTASATNPRRACLRSCNEDMLSCSSRLGRQVGAAWAGTGP